MARPRQKYQDCVLIVFRYITGEGEDSALRRFFPYLNGESGISLGALTACLKEVGYTLTPLDPADVEDSPVVFLRRFQGQAAMFYTSDDRPIAHAVLVDAGRVFDPDPSSPEQGELIDEYLKGVGGEIMIKSLSKVTRTSLQKASRRDCVRKDPLKVKGKLPIFLLLTFLGGTAFTQQDAALIGTKTRKSADSSTLAAAPAYDQVGTIGGNLLGDYHASYTDATGNTSSAYCNTTDASADCHEGAGVIYWVELHDKRRLYFERSRDPAVDLDHMVTPVNTTFDFAAVSGDPLSRGSNGEAILDPRGRLIHFRFRTIQIGSDTWKYFCMPMPIGANLAGREREKYAKHHIMEACYKYDE